MAPVEEAAKTWALVVGIDSYDDPAIRPLSGAVADAVAVAEWLTRTGAPSNQIYLHLAPASGRSPDLTDGLSFTSAREPDIWASIEELRRVENGERLVVYLAGHALYDPATRRLFLTQEAHEGAYVNLGIERYRELFLSFSFRRQFLILDGCQNYPYPENARPTVEAAMHAGVTGFTAQRQNGMAACYAAAQDELALEIGGRGAFTRRLLEAIDPDAPHPDAVALDFATGERFIDLRRAILDVVGPAVAEDVRREKRTSGQTPGLEVHGTFGTVQPIKFLDLPGSAPKRLEITCLPPEAATDLQNVRVAVDDPPYWDYRLPRPPATRVELPLEVHVPDALALRVQALVRPNSPWRETRLDELLMSGTSERLELAFHPKPRGGADPERGSTLRVEPTPAAPPPPPDGWLARPRWGGGAIAGGIGAGGLVISSSVRSTSIGAAERAAERAWDSTPPSVAVELAVADPAAREAHITIDLARGGARRVAGPLAEQRAVVVTAEEAQERLGWRSPSALSLAEVAATPRLVVEPGPVTVRVDLPWGSWRRRVRASSGRSPRVRVPATIGNPPLRVRLLSELDHPGRRLVGLGRAPRRVELITRGTEQPVALERAHARAATWAFSVPAEFDVTSPARLRVFVGRRVWMLPVTNRIYALDLRGDHPRAEPLSGAPFREWDVLISQGRLDALTTEEARRLSTAKWADDLLGVAAAYSLYARQDWEQLSEVVGNLSRLGSAAADVALLTSLLPSGRHLRSANLLAQAALNGHVPLFRWGLQLTQRLEADSELDPSVAAWLRDLKRMAAAQSIFSIATLVEERLGQTDRRSTNRDAKSARRRPGARAGKTS